MKLYHFWNFIGDVDARAHENKYQFVVGVVFCACI